MYHIWTHANGDENLFREGENYIYFLEKYIWYIEPVAETFAYCLMPNHLHAMVRIKEEDEILGSAPDKDLTGFGNLSGLVSKQFSNLFNSYTKSYNKVFERRGSLFERPFKRKLIDSDNYFGTLIAYIHNNPVHHGFARAPDEWTYSSWGAYLHDKPTKIRKDEGLDWFGGRDELIRVHKEINMEKLKSVFED
jgi:putative transposase